MSVIYFSLNTQGQQGAELKYYWIRNNNFNLSLSHLHIYYSWAFGWVYGVRGPNDPFHKKNKNNKKNPTKKIFRPKIFSNQKWTLMKMIFGGIKQSFWTWGFLKCIAQRFYLNWSLTIKTKSCIVIRGCNNSPSLLIHCL